LRTELHRQGQEVYEIDSPDTGRALLMGAQDLDCGRRSLGARHRDSVGV
jgi:hypothetical protein